MLKVDQSVRKKQWKVADKLWRKHTDKKHPNYKRAMRKLFKELAEVDSMHTRKLKKIVYKYDWPGINLVGKRGARAAWLLVQHATHDLPFQKRCLELMLVALKSGDVDKKCVAFLTDRILVLENKKQIYGTQFKGEKKW